MTLHKKCMRRILRFLLLEGNVYAPDSCDYCTEWSARQLRGVPGWED